MNGTKMPKMTGAVRTANGFFVGRIEGSAYIKEVFGSKHRLRFPPAWAFDAKSMDEFIIPCGVTEIIVIDRETNEHWHTTTKNFLEHRGVIDRHHGRQYFLALIHWGKGR